MKLPRPNAAILKWIALVSMLIDHTAACFLNVARGADGRSLKYSLPMGVTIYRVCRGIGRTALPIFCFLLVEGFFYTKDRGKYLARLLLFGFMAQPFFEKAIYYDHSVRRLDTLFTLAIGFAAIWTLEWMRTFADRMTGNGPADRGEPGNETGVRSDRKTAFIKAAFFCAGCAAAAGWAYLACRIHADYRHGGVLAIVLLYYFRGHRETALTMEWVCLSVYSESELMAFPGILLSWLYNGERGRQNKYLFYLFYPCHLLILYLLRVALTGQ